MADMVIKLRGLPFAATGEEVVEFFEGIEIVGGADGVLLTTGRDGRPSGEGYIELVNQDDIAEAEKKDKEHMGKRYIEVFTVKKSEMEWEQKRKGKVISNNQDSSVVRLRGLPFECNKDDITKFFEGIEIYPNGIAMPLDWQGRPSGEAFVQFTNKSELEKALEKDKETIGHRYIEIFRASIEEVRVAMEPGMDRRGGGGPGPRGRYGGRPSPYDARNRFRGGGYNDGPANTSGYFYSSGDNTPAMGPHVINARGLPFRASEQDIADFFLPLTPTNIHIVVEGGFPSGRACVEFATHEDAVEAMKKDKQHIQSRYIELFLDSIEEAPAPVRGGDSYDNGYNEGPIRGGGDGYGNGYDGPGDLRDIIGSRRRY